MNDIPTMESMPVSVSPEVTEEKPASHKVTYATFFWLFLFGSVMGFFLEGIWYIIRKGEWANHASAVWGPFCIIYGVGLIAVYVISAWMENRNLFLQFVIFCATGGLIEYLFSFLQEKCFGSTSWNYSKYPMNIDGRVSLHMTLIWGILGTMFARFIFRRLLHLFENMQTTLWRRACTVLTVFMAVNLLLTSAAVLRWRSRRIDNAPAKNRVERYLDENYDNDTMKALFPNMKFKKKTSQ